MINYLLPFAVNQCFDCILADMKYSMLDSFDALPGRFDDGTPEIMSFGSVNCNAKV